MKQVLLLLIGIAPISLLAHGSHGSGIVAGFTHPILGWDHCLAILGLVLWAIRVYPERWYYISAIFLT